MNNWYKMIICVLEWCDIKYINIFMYEYVFYYREYVYCKKNFSLNYLNKYDFVKSICYMKELNNLYVFLFVE